MIELSDFILDESSDFIRLDSIEEYSNIVNDTYTFLLESNKKYNNINKSLYSSILESNSYNILNESFNSFFYELKDILDNIVKYIKKLIDKFILSINLNNKNQKIKFNNIKNIISNRFTDDISFYNNDYIIYNLNKDIPSAESLVKSSDDILDINNSLCKIKDTESLSKYINKTLNSLDSKFNKYRANILGSNSFILKEDFESECMKSFISSYGINVDRDYILKCIEFIDNYDSTLKEIKATKKTLEQDYNRVQKNIDMCITRNKSNDTEKMKNISINYDANSDIYDKQLKVVDMMIDEKSLAMCNIFMKKCSDKLINLANDHLLAFTLKLNCMNNLYIQSNKIIDLSLNKLKEV